MEDDLVILIENIMASNLIIGTDVGVISYNETPLKKLLINGITTISTDFKLMGSLAADLINNQVLEHREVPFSVTLRPSI